MLETRLLHYYLAVAREQSITKAAQSLHITQPTLSRQMALLEEQTGASLFVRGSRPLVLTPEGLLLRRRAEEILELVEKTEQELSSQSEELEGCISLGCGELASMPMVTEFMAEFNRRHPLVTYNMYTATADQVKERIDAGLTDIGILLEPVDMEKYEFVRLPVKEVSVAIMPAGVPLAKRPYVTAKDLVDIPVILPSRQKVYDQVASWFGPLYAKIKVICTSNLSTNAALMVRAGMGYALMVEGSMPFLDTNELCMVPLYPELIATSVLAWKREQPATPAVRQFIREFRDMLSKHDSRIEDKYST